MNWLGRHRLSILAGICIFITAGVIALHFAPGIPFFSSVWRSEQGVQDLLRREGRKTPTRSDFVWIGINQEALEYKPVGNEATNRALQLMAAQPYPWSREVWALLLDRLFGAGARLVMFDILFSAPREGDEQFHAALDHYHDRVVLGANFDFSEAVKIVPPSASLIPEPQMRDDRVGYVIFIADQLDRKVRSIYYTLTLQQLAGSPPG